MNYNFDYNGHHYEVVKVEGSTDCVIIRDGRQTRNIQGENLFAGDELNYDTIINLF